MQLEGRHLEAAHAIQLPTHLNLAACLLKGGAAVTALQHAQEVGQGGGGAVGALGAVPGCHPRRGPLGMHALLCWRWAMPSFTSKPSLLSLTHLNRAWPVLPAL